MIYKKQIKFDDLPKDVVEVKALQISKCAIGSTLYKKAMDTIEKYPQYFPWEHNYKSIPKEVHDAFLKEAYPEKFMKPKYVEFNGVLSKTEKIKTATFDSGRNLYDILKDIKVTIEKNRIEEIKNDNRIKSIWNKHYKKYGLSYRSGL